MTSIEPMAVPCPLCRTVSEQMVLISTSSFGEPDLDTRPALLARDTYEFMLAECPACGYVFAPLPEEAGVEWVEDGGIRDLVAAERYRRADDGKPEVARRFRRGALLAEHDGRLDDAGWFLVRAAWACDDAGDPDAANAYRVDAVEMFRACRSAGVSFVEPDAAGRVLVADLLRRSGRFEEALELTDPSNVPEWVAELLAQERELIEVGDTAAHQARAR